MAKQPEQILEEQLLAQLKTLGYGLVLTNDEKRVKPPHHQAHDMGIGGAAIHKL